MYIWEKVEYVVWDLTSGFKMVSHQEPLGHVWHKERTAKQKQMNPQTQVNSPQENRGSLATPAEDGKGRGYPQRGPGDDMRGPG